ncbi:MAG: GldG family protein [Gammaproteobacteria bacterium]
MKVTRTSRLLLHLQTLASTLLFIGIIGLLAWLSTRYVYQADWTAGNRNTVTDDTRSLLAELAGPVTVTAYARENELLRRQILELINSYRRFKDDIVLEFVNPDSAPERVRELGISSDGELIIAYQGRSEHIQALNEQQLTNALLRLAHTEDRWVAFMAGHGERDPLGEANHSMGLFGKEMQRKGLRPQSIQLLEAGIPANARVLVVAGPRVSLLPGEVALLQEYVARGGNLLWLAEPGDLHGLEPLAEQLGVAFLPGKVVDATTQAFGIDNPSFVLVTRYPNHAITAELQAVSVFPEAAALEINTSDWHTTPLLSTLTRAWTELGALEGEIRFDPDTDERAGPLDIGVALTRTLETAEDNAGTEQRIVVIGDGDFLSNTYLGNAGNLDLGMNILHWLSHDDAFIDISVTAAPDTHLELGRTARGAIGLGFMAGLPLLLLFSGLVIWLRRRRR